MNLIEVVADGFADVRANAGRTALQTLGVVLGVASVVGTMGLTAGQQQQMEQFHLETGGGLKVMVYSRPPEVMRATARQQASRGLTVDDVEAIRTRIEGFDLVESTVRRRLLVRGPRATKSYGVVGCSPGYGELQELRVGSGRFITADDIATAASVCVLGADRAQEFFGTENAVGKILRIGDHAFRVAGVLEHREFYWNRTETWNALGWMNDLIIMPVTALQARQVGAGSRRVDELGLRLASAEVHQESMATLRRLLLARHGIEDYQIFDRKDRIDQAAQQGMVYDMTFKVCGLISLLVGGIVVANIMLASFTERMREVGIRKALGAKGWHIAVQFLIEGVIVTGFGALAGLTLGIGFVHGIARLLDQSAVITPAMVLAAAVCAASVALLFGVYPAIKASRLDPVVALRYE